MGKGRESVSFFWGLCFFELVLRLWCRRRGGFLLFLFLFLLWKPGFSPSGIHSADTVVMEWRAPWPRSSSVISCSDMMLFTYIVQTESMISGKLNSASIMSLHFTHLFPPLTTNTTPALDMLATHPSHQHHGAASALVKWGTDLADAEGLCVCLEATSGNDEFYRKFGF
jgi:GNAT superfamily N-acetyltransferase